MKKLLKGSMLILSFFVIESAWSAYWVNVYNVSTVPSGVNPSVYSMNAYNGYSNTPVVILPGETGEVDNDTGAMFQVTLSSNTSIGCLVQFSKDYTVQCPNNPKCDTQPCSTPQFYSTGGKQDDSNTISLEFVYIPPNTTSSTNSK